MTSNVYALLDPHTNEVRYVGMTGYPLNWRFNHHLSPKNLANKARRAWIDELLSEGKEPLFTVLAEIPGVGLCEGYDQALVLEKQWIHALLADGHRLTNLHI